MIDGDHHPPVVRSALDGLRETGHEVVGAVFCGGSEKVDSDDLQGAFGVPVATGEDLLGVLDEAITRWKPEKVMDVSDEPILTSTDRFRFASLALQRGVVYAGADFSFDPPGYAEVLSKPSISVFATGKRTGKTAIASALATHASAAGFTPVIVTIGRGGPKEPVVIEAGEKLDVETLISYVEEGRHAASDYIEDALTSGVTTIGCVRAGGGLAGATVMSTMQKGAEIAQARDEDLVILEGSGSSMPDVAAAAGLVCVPATLEPELVTGFLNPYRLLKADLCVVTMAEEASRAAAVEAAITSIVPELPVLPVVFRPKPMSDVRGRKVFLCTTAPSSAADVFASHLRDEHGCEVVGSTHKLSDRAGLRSDLADAPDHDVVLCELKAAAVDVVARAAKTAGVDVVFVNNVPVSSRDRAIEERFDDLLKLASSRAGI